MNPSDNDLEIRVERNHALSVWGARAVIFGVAVEFVLAVLFREHKSFLENWGPVAGDALVGLGVAAEVHFASKSGNASEELRRRATDRLAETRMLAFLADGEATNASAEAARALNELAVAKRGLAEANERAANTELKAAEAYERAAKLEELTGWRSITPELTRRIGAVIKSLDVNIRLGIAVIPHDTEAANLQYAIATCFCEAGVLSFSAGQAQPSFGSPFGVYLCTSEEINEYKIGAAFSAEGIRVECSLIDFSSIFSTANGGPNVCFFVAAKPSPGHGFRPYVDVDQIKEQRIRPHVKLGENGRIVR